MCRSAVVVCRGDLPRIARRGIRRSSPFLKFESSGWLFSLELVPDKGIPQCAFLNVFSIPPFLLLKSNQYCPA